MCGGSSEPPAREAGTFIAKSRVIEFSGKKSAALPRRAALKSRPTWSYPGKTTKQLGVSPPRRRRSEEGRRNNPSDGFLTQFHWFF